jgi:hypothetical protein
VLADFQHKLLIIRGQKKESTGKIYYQFCAPHFFTEFTITSSFGLTISCARSFRVPLPKKSTLRRLHVSQGATTIHAAQAKCARCDTEMEELYFARYWAVRMRREESCGL